MTINNERKLVFLERQQDELRIDRAQVIKELKEETRKIRDETVRIGEMKLERKKAEELLELLSRGRNVSAAGIFEAPSRNDDVLLSSCAELQRMIITAHTSAIQALEQLEKQFDLTGGLHAQISENKGQLAAIDWKISLKTVKDTDTCEFELRSAIFSKLLAIEKSSALEASQEIDTTEMEIGMNRIKMSELNFKDTEELEDKIKDYQKDQLELGKRMLDLDSEIQRNMKNVVEIKLKINKAALIHGLDQSYIETLFEIEAFIMMNQNLSVDYHGPILKYLETGPDPDKLIWPQISSIAKTILFARGSTARKVNRLLLEPKKKLGSYVLLGIDEFVPRIAAEVPEELIEIVDEAKGLVRNDIRLSKILKTLLREAVLSKKADLSCQTLGQFVCSHNANGFYSSLDCLSIESSQPPQIKAHVHHLQATYALVKEHASLILRIEQGKSVKPVLEKLLKRNEDDIKSLRQQVLASLPVSAFKESIDLLKLKLLQKKRFMQKEANYQSFREMKDISGNINSWIVDELVQAKEQKVLEVQRITKEIGIQEQTELSELKKSILTMSTGMSLLMSCFDELSCCHNSRTDLVDMCKKSQKKFDSEIKEIRRKLLKASAPVQVSAKLQIGLMDLRSRLYEKNSELSVVDHAIQLCYLPDNVDDNLYEAMKNEDIEADLIQCQRMFQAQKTSKLLRLMSKDHYIHLVQSITNVNRYSETQDPVISRHKFVPKSLPLLNKFAVKVLKDAVYNYRTSFANVMEDYARKPSLFFYTRGVFDELRVDQFSWNSFDLGRLKAMDFLVKWKRDCRENVSLSSIAKIKALLLIAHIVNYLSIFKFIIIDESLYDVSDGNIVIKVS